MNFQTAVLKLLGSIVMASILLSVATRHSYAQQAVRPAESERTLTDAELGGDPALNFQIQLTSKSLSVEDA